MLLSICELPLWASTVLLVLLPTAVAMCGPVLVRRQVDLARLTTNNEIAGFKFATVGVIYAVLLAFAVIAVWEKFSEAEEMVTKEAGAAATLYRLAAGSEPEAAGAKAALNNYLRLAIDRDWPAMAKEKESRDVTRALDGLYAAILRLPETEVRKSAALAEMLKQLDEMTESRRTRLHLATGIVPTMLWVVLCCGAVMTIGFTFFFGTKNLGAQITMTGILAVIVFMGLLVIVSFDHPFTGPVHVDAAPLQIVLDDFGQDK
jgi:Na+/melibiose symporter-like transporter